MAHNSVNDCGKCINHITRGNMTSSSLLRGNEEKGTVFSCVRRQEFLQETLLASGLYLETLFKSSVKFVMFSRHTCPLLSSFAMKTCRVFNFRDFLITSSSRFHPKTCPRIHNSCKQEADCGHGRNGNPTDAVPIRQRPDQATGGKSRNKFGCRFVHWKMTTNRTTYEARTNRGSRPA